MLGVRTWLLVAVAVVSPACETTPEEQLTTACTAICACRAAPLPGVQEECVTKCTKSTTTPLSDQCVACVSGNDRCSTIEDVCGPICDPPRPFNDGGI